MRLGVAAFAGVAPMLRGNIIREGANVGGAAGPLGSVSAVFFGGATGLGLVSFWLVAGGAHSNLEREKINTSEQVAQ